jgi:hypothetical protein
MRGISDEVLTVQCEPGEVATGGGAVFTSGSMDLVQLLESRPDPLQAGATPRGWAVRVRSRSSQEYSFDAIVVCVAES